MTASTDQQPDGADPATELPPEFAFAVGERVTGPGVSGKVVDRPGPWSVAVVQNGVRMTASASGLRKA